MIVRAPRQQVLWLVRHGETDWNRMGWVQGHLDSPRLTRRGRAQARRVASLLVTKDVGAVYSSDLRRARSTADIIGRTLGLPVQTDARLRERSFGRLEGAPTGSLRPEVTGIVGGRIADIVAHPVEGESLTDVADRCADFVSWLGSRSGRGDIVIVAHGGTVRLLRAALAGTPLTGLSWGTVANASVHRITYPTLPTGPLPPLAVPVGAPQTRHPTPGLHPTPSGH
jgi:broad specificity phosphatase PhoE